MTHINDYITNDYKPLDAHRSVADVREFFDEVHYSHFPVVEESVYIGCIGGEDIDTFDDDREIGSYRYAMEGFFARKDMIWMDVLELFARNQANLVPVLDEQNKYLGYYEIPDIIRLFNETPFMNEPGGIVIVEKPLADYSMSQVTQIVESNNGKILGVFISEATTDKIQITIKISLGGINEILQTFRRYNYEVISEHAQDDYMNSLKERSDYLDKYLNI